MQKAHLTRHGFYERTMEADVIEGEGTFTPLPDFDEDSEIPLFVGLGWQVVPLSVRDSYQPPEPPLAPVSAAEVNVERDRRTVAGFGFNGVRFQSRPEDRENIMGAFALASTALTVGGKKPGDLRWHGGSSDFVFIAADDSRVPMDAVAVLGLGQAAAAQKSALTFAASDLKKLDPIPVDFTNDRHWPDI